ncbi:hypothetical protein bcgnr5376_59090 [Bacillus cereus]
MAGSNALIVRRSDETVEDRLQTASRSKLALEKVLPCNAKMLSRRCCRGSHRHLCIVAGAGTNKSGTVNDIEGTERLQIQLVNHTLNGAHWNRPTR